MKRIARAGINILIVGLWLWFYRPVFDYLSLILTREDFRTNQIVLVLIAALIVFQLRRERISLHLDAPPQWYAPALALSIGGSILFLLLERLVDIDTFSASVFGLASYGLLGLWMRPQTWRQGIPAALLVVGVLPFGEHMQTFVGYPMRILTASIVRDGLAAAGIPSIGVDTILVLENGVSQIDLPCSGVKSLWTGALFLLAATWIERRPITWRWIATAAAFAALLFAVNVTRIAMLVVVGQVIGSRLGAELIHVPMGVLGFIVACAAAVGMLQWVPALSHPHAQDNVGRVHRVLERPVWLAPSLAAVLVTLVLAYTPAPVAGLTETAPARTWAAEMGVQMMPLQPDELEWFTRDGAESAERYRFSWHGMAGSMILITSTNWRAHHRPERCFEVYGLAVDDSSTLLVAPDFPVRWVAVSRRNSPDHWSATYWFQTGDRVTDDYGTRIADDLSLKHNRWVLVSVLFDGTLDPHVADLTEFYSALRGTLKQ